MHPFEETPEPRSDRGLTPDEMQERIDFTVDSAGNVALSARRRAAQLGERRNPPRSGWPRRD